MTDKNFTEASPEKSQPQTMECPTCQDKLSGNGFILWCENGHVFEIPAEAAPPSSPSLSQTEIVPPIDKQHKVAQQIASEHMFDPRESAYARCVGAIMQAWRPGVIWETDAPSSPSPTEQDKRIGEAYDKAREHPRENHPTIAIQVWADIDEGIAELVKYLNTLPDVRTDASCQGTLGEGGPAPYRAYVMATWPAKLEARLAEEFDLELLGEHRGYVQPRVGSPSPQPCQESVMDVAKRVGMKLKAKKLSWRCNHEPDEECEMCSPHKDEPRPLCNYPGCGKPRSAEVHNIVQCLPEDHAFVGSPTLDFEDIPFIVRPGEPIQRARIRKARYGTREL